MNYYDWSELVTEVLGVSVEEDPDDYNDKKLLEAGQKELAKAVFADPIPLPVAELRDWVKQFAELWEDRNLSAPLWKGLAQVENDTEFCQYLRILLPYLWD